MTPLHGGHVGLCAVAGLLDGVFGSGGDTVGYYIPARQKRADTERAALKEAASRLQQVLAAEGISEDEILADFKRWRGGKKK